MMQLRLLTTLGLLLWTLGAHAGPLTAILSLKKGAEISKEDLRQVTRHREVVKVEPLFSAQEKKILKSMKATYLGRSWTLEMRSEKSFEVLEKVIRRQGLPLQLDWNEMKISTLDFTDMQWGLANRGEAQLVDLDPMLVYKVQARSGQDIQLPATGSAPQTKRKIRVAVLDTGIDPDHPDLGPLILTKPSECEALEKFKVCVTENSRDTCEKTWMDPNNPEADTDGNGYPMDCRGWSVVDELRKLQPGRVFGRPDFRDLIGHGTHVAGVAGAIRNNGVGIDGVASNIELIPIQVISRKISEPLKPLSTDLSPEESSSAERRERSLAAMVARGVIYAIHSGAQVINFSMGWPQVEDSQFMRSVVAEAQSRGIIIVAAAGNDSTKALLRPCAYEGVVCVGAHGPDGAVTHFSNYGSGVEIFAPGLNILSTYPEDIRPIRFRKTLGYEFLSGTSQATPFVTGAVAELLSMGVPPNEILPRLVLGTRPIQKALPLTEGTPHSVSRELPEDPLSYEKYGLGGLMDFTKSLKVSARPFLIPLAKEKTEIPWDRKADELTSIVQIKNYWLDVPISQVTVTSEFLKSHPEAVRPRIVSLLPAKEYEATWKSQEVREYKLVMKLEDAPTPAESRIPSDLELTVHVNVAGQGTMTAHVPFEVTVLVTKDEVGPDVRSIPVIGMPKGPTETTPIDQYFDNEPSRREYFVTAESQNTHQVWVMQMKNETYNVVGGNKIRLAGDMKNIQLYHAIRMHWNTDQSSDYVLGYYEDKSEDPDAITSPFSFFVFDENMSLIDSFVFDSNLAQMPFEIFWQRVGNVKMPAWVGPGKDPDKKRGLRDRWENPEDYEPLEIRLYYLDENKKLKALKDHEGFKFIDILQPTGRQQREGRVPVLLAKNRGSESKPSYIYDFAVAEVIDGKIENFRTLNLFSEDQTYRNILDTRVDRIISLDGKADYLAGTYWFGEGKPRQQRLTTFNNQNDTIMDFHLGALRAQFDSALFVRGVFWGPKDGFAYVLTNSEIQLHHLNKGTATQVSLDRYSFFAREVYVNVYSPFTLRSSKSDTMLPGLLIPEGTGLNRGVRMLAPVFAYSGEIMELVSPARLRFKTDKKLSGCTPMETPVNEGERGTSLDFYCGDKMLRINLAF